MKRTVWANEQVTASVNASFIPVTIDVDDSDATAALSRYSVGATPKTIITDSQGNVLQQVEGGMGKTDFLEMLRKLNPITAGDAPLLLCSSIGGAMSPLVWRMYRSVRGYPAGPTKEGGSEQPQ